MAPAKNASFFSTVFVYVCPEPGLAKYSAFGIKWRKMGSFRTDDELGGRQTLDKVVKFRLL
jgi:hypothetical protein